MCPVFSATTHPVELEIGVGKGRFLLLAAAARPETNFIGIEVARAYHEKTLDRLAKRALTNVRLVHGEAGHFVARCLGPASLAAIHVYFPDPWPKKRHHKRRLIRPAVLEHFARVLAPGGLLRVVTDHADYALVIGEVLTANPEFEKAAATPGLWELPGMGDYTTGGVTNFEIKYRREGRPIHRFAFLRR
ncbi:MAG: tRNA (guanosine(46)-N7)-methyltransferase TrmB [Acidobacteriota bacterium]|nr:tRNA (guanosine(46)-N7)-methyltransferase TrmB [Acidobacteriota bacterium]